jgi:hypothetical protein
MKYARFTGTVGEGFKPSPTQPIATYTKISPTQPITSPRAGILIKLSFYPTTPPTRAGLKPAPTHSSAFIIVGEGLKPSPTDVDGARAAAQAQLDTINKIPAALLRRAFRGEI